jgi:hypothetical protein
LAVCAVVLILLAVVDLITGAGRLLRRRRRKN